MKKIVALFFALFITISLTPLALAQNNFRNDEVSTLQKNETIDKDYFATGEKVILSGTVNGDAYLAGGNITVDGIVNGDLLAAGGNINITGDVTGDIRVAGGNIQVDGTVGGNLTTLGGSIRVDDDSGVTGSMVAGGGSIEVYGPIGKGITAGAGTLMLANSVGGDVVTGVGELDLGPNAVINGGINYVSEKKVGIADGASVSGRISHQVPPQRVDEEDKEKFLAGAAVGWVIFKFLSLLVIGSILLWALPVFMKNVSESITKQPLQSLGVGFLVLILIPIAAVVLIMTVIGLPLGLVTLLGYFFILYISKVFVALALGERILGFKQSHYLSLALGLLILSVILLIPVLGGLVEFVAMLLGLGAAVATKRSMLLNLRSKKLL